MIEYVQVAYSRLVQGAWRTLPVLLTIACMLLTSLPLHVLEGHFPAPDIALISLFFWAMHGQGFMPAWGVFLLGLARDLQTGAPLGFWVVIYLFAYGFTLTQRIFFKGRTGIGSWLGFALVAVLAGFACWLLGMAVFARWLPPDEIALQVAVTLVFHPLLSRLFMLFRRVLTTAPETL